MIHLCIPISVGDEVRFAILSNLNMKPEIKQLDLALKDLQPTNFPMSRACQISKIHVTVQIEERGISNDHK